jgi:hypothetical protein
MKLPRALRHRSIQALCAASFLLLVTEGSRIGLAQTEVSTLEPAALTLQSAGSYSLSNRVVRCRSNQRAGIVAASSGTLAIRDVVVEGCGTGVIASGASVYLERVTVRGGGKLPACTIGILLSGNLGIVSGNIVGGCRYGIVVTGNENTIESNQSNDNAEDGFLITGDSNTVVGNEALRNGQAGVRVARMVPMIAANKLLPFIQDPAVGNAIHENTALDNKTDLVEFGQCESAPLPPLPNEWTNNLFGTRQPSCIN